MTEQEAEVAANEFKALVATRTWLKSAELQCPREKSEMTPCLARDGNLVVAFGGTLARPERHAMCIGCEADLEELLAAERAKH